MDCFGQVVSTLADRTRPEGDAPAPDRRALVIALAPPSPPCFADRLLWLEYLCDAQVSANGNVRGPLDLRKTPVSFNLDFDFCEDCSAKYAREMQVQGRCIPGHLRKLKREGSDD
jgi:hypothetical protein